MIANPNDVFDSCLVLLMADNDQYGVIVVDQFASNDWLFIILIMANSAW